VLDQRPVLDATALDKRPLLDAGLDYPMPATSFGFGHGPFGHGPFGHGPANPEGA
jgi:hypothetical protein